MNEQLENLVVLQAQDLDLARLRGELADAPRQVKRAETAFAEAEKTLAGVRSALAAEEKLRRNYGSEAGTQRSKVDRLRRSLDAATSAAQVTAFEREIHFAQSAIVRLEDDELASMERTEQLEGQLQAGESQVSRAETQLTAERSRAARLTAEHNQLIAGIEEQRRTLRAEIEPARLSIYDRLSKAKGTAVAEAVGTAAQGKCAACQMAVRPQRWQDLIGLEHRDEIYTCESCGRMLFWDPRRDTPKAWEAGDRLRAAQSGAPAGGSR